MSKKEQQEEQKCVTRVLDKANGLLQFLIVLSAMFSESYQHETPKPAMQLWKACLHPLLFDRPIDSETGEGVFNAELVKASSNLTVFGQSRYTPSISHLFKGHTELDIGAHFTESAVVRSISVSSFGLQRKLLLQDKWHPLRMDCVFTVDFSVNANYVLVPVKSLLCLNSKPGAMAKIQAEKVDI